MKDIRDRAAAGQEIRHFARDTIFAVASGGGVAGVAVVRISGPMADECLSELTRTVLPPFRQAVVRRLLDSDGSFLDQALVLRFPEGGSFTGEPVLELHCHGSVAVIRRLLDRLADRPGCRIAEPGEFTRRAFEEGRLDLAQIEALGDLLAAETEEQRRLAIRGLDGELARLAGRWRRNLVRALALVEVTVDWADEEVPDTVPDEAHRCVEEVVGEMRRELARSDAAERLRSGLEVAILGPPNAGKSSLLNAIARRSAALVSPVAGTTRDVIEVRYDLRGLPVIFLDTAGLRLTEDPVEQLGIGEAVGRASRAALRLFLSAPDQADSDFFEELRQPHDLEVRTKTDLRPGRNGISALTGSGITDLLDTIHDTLAPLAFDPGPVSHVRQRQALMRAIAELEDIEGLDSELVAERLRRGLHSVGALIGMVGVEDVLEEIFASFCLGK